MGSEPFVEAQLKGSRIQLMKGRIVLHCPISSEEFFWRLEVRDDASHVRIGLEEA
jgi:hypothetical protein